MPRSSSDRKDDWCSRPTCGRRSGSCPAIQLHVHLSGRELVLQRPRDAVAELRGLVSSTATGRSLVDELLAERRAAAHAAE